MIDTLILRIHEYDKHKHLVNQLKDLANEDFTVKFIHAPMDDINKTSVLFGDTGRVLPVHLRTSVYIPSSHYSISVFPNEARNFIEINLSVPKFEYSNNVLQFVDPHNQSIDQCFLKLQSFLLRFFNKYFVNPPEWKHVEVNRIDLCFNQIFLTKEDALRYLAEQKDLNIEHARSDKNKFQNYGGTTLQFHTDTYSFKIYHKGTEFKKNDLPKLLKNNPKGLDLNELSNVADRMLRYEMSCKKGLLNYVFRQSVKDDVNTIFNHHFENITKFRTFSRNNFVKVATNRYEWSSARNSKAVEFLDKTIKNKSFTFCLDSAWENIHTKPHELFEDYNLCFNVELFRALHEFYWKRVQKYQLGVKMSIKDIHDRIINKRNEKRFKDTAFGKTEKDSYVGQLLLLATLSQYTDIGDLKGIIPKATYYRYKKNLEEIGIPRHSPDIAVAPPPLDFQSYFFYFAKYHNTFN